MISITHWHHICYNWQYKGCQVANTSHVPHTIPHILLRCPSHSPHMFLTLLHVFLTLSSQWPHMLVVMCTYGYIHQKSNTHIISLKCVHMGHLLKSTPRYQKTFTSDKMGLRDLHLACVWLAGIFDQLHRQGGMVDLNVYTYIKNPPFPPILILTYEPLI